MITEKKFNRDNIYKDLKRNELYVHGDAQPSIHLE
jgi:hypothetical protein